MLVLLESLIDQSYDRYATLDDEEEIRPVKNQDIERARQATQAILVRIVSGEMSIPDEQIDRAAKAMAHLSGRGAAGAMPSFIGNDIGFKTWGAAPLMAKRLVQERFLPDLENQTVLELGTGTGMVGLICAKLGAASTDLTDYHPSVLENVAINVQLNKVEANVSKLDFIELSTNPESVWRNKKFDVVIASDLLYEMEHAEHLPVAIELLMTNVFYFMIPLRATHTKEVALFESRMEEIGLYLDETSDQEVEEDEGWVRYRFYCYTRIQ
ncbi:putative methyltransferase-domain-containing protein [Phycomyces nitens]|nr:putative methyltransferase-domain-containing protein [Phycomyces nitens]